MSIKKKYIWATYTPRIWSKYPASLDWPSPCLRCDSPVACPRKPFVAITLRLLSFFCSTPRNISVRSPCDSLRNSVDSYPPVQSTSSMTDVPLGEKSESPPQYSGPPRPANSNNIFKMAAGHARYFRYILFAFFVCYPDRRASFML